jgi:peroxiredoxin
MIAMGPLKKPSYAPGGKGFCDGNASVCKKRFAESGGLTQAVLSLASQDGDATHALSPLANIQKDMPIATGARAPDFTLKTKTAEGLKDVRLSDNFGKKQTLILFFPLAFTGTCTQEMCDVSAGLGDYAGLNAEVYGISVDSPFAQEAWAKQSKIGVTLLSDLDKKTSSAYGVIFPGLAGIGDTSARAAFVVGVDGVVKYAEQTATPKDLPNFSAIRAAIAK